MRSYLNAAARRDDQFRGVFDEADYLLVRNYVDLHPELPPTPLKSLRWLARTIGAGSVDAKDETHRFGLNAFKIAGVHYAIHRLQTQAAGPGRPSTDLSRGLVCATAGNHGRAVARVARQHRVPCTVFVPAGRTRDPVETRTRTARIAAMQADGATVVDVDGSYEDAVRRAAGFGAESGGTIVSDTSWDGYEEIPRWIMAGYTRLLDEAARQWTAPPTVVIVQAGVGGLVGAAANWFAWHFGANRPYFIAAEPDDAACLLASARAGQPTTIDSRLNTIMAGLRCAAPSPAAWPSISAGVDAFVTVPDSAVVDMMRRLQQAAAPEQIDAGPSGACGAAALLAVASAPELRDVRTAARLDRATRAMVIITEGR